MAFLNLNKDPESWARVDPKSVLSGSQAQAENVLTMALFDIQKLGLEVERLRKLAPDLLNALQRLASAWDAEELPANAFCRLQARDAIAKATGNIP